MKLFALVLAGCTLAPHGGAISSGDARVDALLQRMTLDEKLALLHGAPEGRASDQGEAGYLPGVPRLGIPALRLADGPPGVLTRHPATALPATMALAATFSAGDARADGVVIAHEAQALGIDVVLEPYLNIHRDQTFGRAYNTYGEDPLLTGTIGAAVIRGIQGEGIMAQAKHFIGYDGASNMRVGGQALNEIYLPPFEAAVTAGVASIMCSYNQINGSYACGNRALMEDVLRGRLGFRGFVTSDWGATHATLYVNDGLDLEMPGSGSVIDSYFAAVPSDPLPAPKPPGPVVNDIPEEISALAPASAEAPSPPAVRRARPIGMRAAMRQGRVSETTITRAAGRVLVEMDRFGLLDRPRFTAGEPAQPTRAADAAIGLKIAEDAAVLLKNDAALPLSADGPIAMIGPGALQDIAVGDAGEKALGRIERQIGPGAALQALLAQQKGPRVVEAVADDMSGRTIPATAFARPPASGGAGLLRIDAAGKPIAIDPRLDFTRAGGDPLPPGSSFTWTGTLNVPSTGRYRLYLQVLGARGEIALDDKPLAATRPLYLHGNVLQPGQDNVLPTLDGLDNLRCEVRLAAGPHRISVRIAGDESGRKVEVRLAWVTPAQREADYRQAIEAARQARTAVVFAWSRGKPAFALPGDQNRLIADVAAANPNTIVVLNLSEPVAMPWLDKVKAVLLMWFPGDEGGRATAELLTGRAAPAGRLPFTWPKALLQNVANDPAHPERASAGIAGSTSYSEGIFVGYRWFDQQHLTPLYPFGYGLSYTRFDYADLSVGRAADGGLEVDFRVRNAGTASGDEVAQLYLGPPHTPPAGAQFAPRALAAFARIHLAPGESRRIRLHAAPRALQYWSESDGTWRTAPGGRSIYVAASSRDTRLTANVPPRKP